MGVVLASAAVKTFSFYREGKSSGLLLRKKSPCLLLTDAPPKSSIDKRNTIGLLTIEAISESVDLQIL